MPLRLLLAAIAVLLAVAAMIPTVAFARTTRLHQDSFGSSIPSGSPEGLVVDQASGDVYATVRYHGVDQGPGESESQIWRFTAAGDPDNFTAGSEAGTNKLTGFGNTEINVSIDRSGGPLNGAIYVSQNTVGAQNAIVKVFASSGASLGTITGIGLPGDGLGDGICGISVDQSNGAVYIADSIHLSGEKRHIWRYTPNSPSGPISDADYTLAGISVGVGNVCGGDLAVDSDSVYEIAPNSRALVGYPVSSFSSDFSNAPASTTIDSGTTLLGVTAVALDPETGEVYANEGGRVAVFDAGGTFLYRFGTYAYSGATSAGIAVKSAASGSANVVYVSDPRTKGGQIAAYGPTVSVATFTHLEVGSFGSDGTSGSSFAGGDSPDQLTFDQAGRRLYATDPAAPGIYGFDASSPPVFPPSVGFTPLSTAATGSSHSFPSRRSGIAVDNTALASAGNLYLASGSTNLLYGWNSAGTPLGGAFPIDPSATPGGPAASPAQLCGVAVDSAGNIWVSNFATERIFGYSPAGAPLPTVIDTSGQGRSCQLAFDSNDDLYAGIGMGRNGERNIRTNGVWKYAAASGYTAATQVAEESPEAIAVDPSTNHLYTLSSDATLNWIGLSWIDEYDAAGHLLDEFAPPLTSFANGISVDATNHDLYVADREAHKVHVFARGALLPEVVVRPTTAVTNTTATLNGAVVTQGVTLSDCHFEYVSEAAFNVSGFGDLSSGGSVACDPAAASIPLDNEEHAVSANITGLVKNTAYRFRLSAANSDGAAHADETFFSDGPSLVETTGSPLRTASTARLEGRVDPFGKATSYHFEYGTEGPCDANPCQSTESHPAGSGREIELVSQAIEGLQPATTYHYRVVADNGNSEGAAAGQDMTVTTRASDAPLSHGRLPGPPGSDRAYEQVSLPDTGGNPVPDAFAVSDNGGRAFYRVAGGTPISSTGTPYNLLYAERTPSGWRSQDVFPPRDQLVATNWLEPAGRSDLSDQIVTNYNNVTGAMTIWRMRPGQPASRVFQPDVIELAGPVLSSEDASRVLMRRSGSLDPAHSVSNGAPHLYDVSSDTPHLVDLMPDGSVPACEVEVSRIESGPVNVRSVQHWVSADGSRAFFASRGDCSGDPQLYVREFGPEQTKLISGPPLSGPSCATSAANFLRSNAEAAFFLTRSKLSPEDTGSTAQGCSDADVYRYDFDDGSHKCLTCVVAGVQLELDGSQISMAEDGSRVYFDSAKALVPGAGAGIYRINVANGSLAYVAPLTPGDTLGEISNQGATMAPDGSVLIFRSSDPRLNALGGQQNGGTAQYYRYDDRDRSLTCVSCPQNGGIPVSASNSALITNLSEEVGANRTVLSADGEVFAFATTTALVPADQNTARSGQSPQVGADVYEWRDGRLHLITDGLTNWPPSSPPWVSAVTPSGHDIFFTAAKQYTQDALDGYRRLYDARIGGGFEFPAPPKPCPLEVCQGTPKGSPEEASPGSASFAGPVSAHPRAHHKKKRHKKRTKRHQVKKHVKHNRGATR